MKKHKARRKQRQAQQTSQSGYFNPRNHYKCMSESCRRARKCLGRAMICGCTINFVAEGTISDAENLRQLRKAMDKVLAYWERQEARGLVPPDPIMDDPNIPQEEKDRIMRAEIAERLGWNS